MREIKLPHSVLGERHTKYFSRVPEDCRNAVGSYECLFRNKPTCVQLECLLTRDIFGFSGFGACHRLRGENNKKQLAVQLNLIHSSIFKGGIFSKQGTLHSTSKEGFTLFESSVFAYLSRAKGLLSRRD